MYECDANSLKLKFTTVLSSILYNQEKSSQSDKTIDNIAKTKTKIIINSRNAELIHVQKVPDR